MPPTPPHVQPATRFCPSIYEHGTTILYTPPQEKNCKADVVFVHGLGGHPYRTWLYKGAVTHGIQHNRHKSSTWKNSLGIFRGKNKAKPGADSDPHRSLDYSFEHSANGNGEGEVAGPSQCYWPFDLLPSQFDHVRVMTYGYDSHPSHFYRGRTVQMNISQHALQLLQSVSDVRATCRGRPIIFVAHSLGGILVKDAILQSAKYEYQPALSDLSSACSAIIFFGTPHQGANAAAYGDLIGRVVGALPLFPSVYGSVLRELRPDGEKLSNVSADFNDVLNKNIHPSQKIQVYSFQEGKGLLNVNGLDEKVVPDASSCFHRRDVEQRSFVMKNHMDMCRMSSAAEPAYLSFRAALAGYLESAEARSQSVPAPGTSHPSNDYQGTVPQLIPRTPNIEEADALILGLTKSLVDASRLTRSNVALREDEYKLLRDVERTREELASRLFLEKQILRTCPLDKPRLVCGDFSCMEFKEDGNGMMLADYPNPCLEECYLEDAGVDTAAHPGIKKTAAFRGNENCQRCRHHWTQHMHILYKLESYTVEVKDVTVEQQISQCDRDIAQRKEGIKVRHGLIVEFEEECRQIHEATVKCSLWIESNSNPPYMDVAVAHLNGLIDIEQAKSSYGGTAGQRLIVGLQEDLAKYKATLAVLKDSMRFSGRSIDRNQVRQLVIQLYNLKHFGKDLKDLEVPRL